MDERTLDATLEAVATAPERVFEMLAERLLVDSAGNPPLLRRLLWFAALPRSFDAKLLATLSDCAVDDPDFVAAIEKLTEFPFVHERFHGWAIHDSVRLAIFKEGASRGEMPSDLNEDLGKLGVLYRRRYEEARKAKASLAQLEKMVRGVSPERYAALSESIEDLMVRAAVESVHTATRRSFEMGWLCMAELYTDLEMDRLHHLCDTLVRGWDGDRRNVARDVQPCTRCGWRTSMHEQRPIVLSGQLRWIYLMRSRSPTSWISSMRRGTIHCGRAC